MNRIISFEAAEKAVKYITLKVPKCSLAQCEASDRKRGSGDVCICTKHRQINKKELPTSFKIPAAMLLGTTFNSKNSRHRKVSHSTFICYFTSYPKQKHTWPIHTTYINSPATHHFFPGKHRKDPAVS